jgi:hypothetical protein
MPAEEQPGQIGGREHLVAANDPRAIALHRHDAVLRHRLEGEPCASQGADELEARDHGSAVCSGNADTRSSRARRFR